MPNWVFNRVTICGSKRKLGKIRKELSTFDDSEISEIEEKLNGTRPMDSYETEERLKKNLEYLKKQNKAYFTNEFDFNRIIPMPENSDTFLAKGGVGAEEQKKFGDNNWYNWSIAHWGTKWNSCDACVASDDGKTLVYEFNTAWAPPAPVIEALGRKYKVEVECVYYDADDFPNSCGSLVYRPKGNDRGFNVCNHDGDVQWVADTFGECIPEDYGFELNDNGEWAYPEEEEDEEEEEDVEKVGENK